MTKPAIRVLKQPPRPMGVAPVHGGVLQARLVAEQGQEQERLEAVAKDLPALFNPEPGDPAIGASREGWVEAPLEPTEAMIQVGAAHLRLPGGVAQIEDAIAKTVYTDMLNARFDEPPVDTQALFGASSSEIKAALTLYRKMKAPKKRKATPSGSPQSS